MASIHELLERGLKRVTEALVFAADTPVPANEIAGVYTDVTGEDKPSESQVSEAVEQLNAHYEETDRVFRIEFWAGGYRMATVSSVAPFLKAYFNREQEQRLSRSLMETLAIVAYRQPVTKPEVDFVRGVDCGYAVNKLLEKGLIDVVGRSDSLGRPLIYGTTRFFLEQFGLKDIDELPDLREIEEILDDPAFNRERAELLQLQQEESLAAGSHAEEDASDGTAERDEAAAEAQNGQASDSHEASAPADEADAGQESGDSASDEDIEDRHH